MDTNRPEMDSTGDAGKEDDDESSYSLNGVVPERKGSSSSETIQSALDEFRVRWQQELKKDGTPSGSPLREKTRPAGNAGLDRDKGNLSIEQQARSLFLQGSELEHSGMTKLLDFTTLQCNLAKQNYHFRVSQRSNMCLL